MIKQKSIVVKTSESTLQYAEMGEIVVNADADCIMTLPYPDSGLWYRVSNVGIGLSRVIYNNKELVVLKQYEQCLFLANGTFGWFMSRGGSTPGEGESGGSISISDVFSSVGSVIESFEGNEFLIGLSGVWYITDTQAKTGTKSLRSTSINNGTSESVLAFTTDGDGEFSFWYKYQTEGGLDKFTALLDGVSVIDGVSGTLDWTKYSSTVTAGEHTLTLRYYKDSSGSTGLDAVFIDDISFIGTVRMSANAGNFVSIASSGDRLEFFSPSQLTDMVLNSAHIDGGNASTVYAGDESRVISLRVYPTKDTSTYQDSAGTNYGSSENLQTGGYSGYFMRSYLHFDLSKIPVGKSIKSAKLYLYKIYVNSYGSDHTYTIRRITSEWGESTLNYSNAPTYSDKYGTVIYTFGAINSYKEHDVTAMVQEWVNGTYPNYGLCSTWESTGYRQNSQWASREHANKDFRPYLEIEYA